jgi:hypothetical protein
MKYPGLLGALTEAGDIQQETGCSVKEAYRIQRQRSDERLEQHQAPPYNIIQFRPRGH